MFRIGEHRSQFEDFEEKKRRHEELKESLSQISEVQKSSGEEESEYDENNSCNHSEEEVQHNSTIGFKFRANTASNKKLGDHKGRLTKAFEDKTEQIVQNQIRSKSKFQSEDHREESKVLISELNDK